MVFRVLAGNLFSNTDTPFLRVSGLSEFEKIFDIVINWLWFVPFKSKSK